MSNPNNLGVLTARLGPGGQQRLFEFLDAVDTATAARFRAWLGVAPEIDLAAAADLFNGASHGRECLGWWRSRDTPPAPAVVPSPARQHARSPLQHMHSQAYARAANRDLTMGGVWLLGGLLVTIGSYSLAVAGRGGGTYIIASGAIFYGAVRLFRGLRA